MGGGPSAPFAGWRAAAVSAERQLHTDQDEVLFDAARPVILNGIEEVITRPDLADRSIFLTRRPGRRLRAGDHGRAQFVDKERRRPLAGRRRSQQ
jgi:hypothetical protein